MPARYCRLCLGQDRAGNLLGEQGNRQDQMLLYELGRLVLASQPMEEEEKPVEGALAFTSCTFQLV